ncbi:uncharacterized protein [Epargyreus clarus]|uniref:uncharacterized protein n=1 Tax=Epargyreus clarus TaxID=520877 RepID=UPI003C2CD5CE
MSSKKETVPAKSKICTKCKVTLKDSKICTKCKSSIKCSKCKKDYEIDCLMLTNKKFQVINKDQKLKWTCQDCQTELSKNSNIQSDNSTTQNVLSKNIVKKPINTTSPLGPHDINANWTPDRITRRQRRANPHIDISTHSLSDNEENSITSDDSYIRRSLPDLSTRINEDILDLKQKIEELTLQLNSAHLEIENLTLEKNTLLQKISQQDLKLNTLSAVHSPRSTLLVKKKTKKLNSTPTQNKSKTGTTVTLQNSENSDNSEELEKESLTQLEESRTLTNKKSPSSKSSNVNQDTTHQQQVIDSNKIWIYGTQQCSGLALALQKSREKSKYQKYTITSLTKPFADTEEVLRGCQALSNITESNKVIICVGENDTNPLKIITELSATCKKLKNHQVIILQLFS